MYPALFISLLCSCREGHYETLTEMSTITSVAAVSDISIENSGLRVVLSPDTSVIQQYKVGDGISWEYLFHIR